MPHLLLRACYQPQAFRLHVAVHMKAVQADADAYYSKTLTLDLSSVEPYVSGMPSFAFVYSATCAYPLSPPNAGPNHVKTMSTVSDLGQQRIAIQKVTASAALSVF